MNYTQLSTLLQDYTQNYSTEFVAAIPSIVELAEDRIYQSVQIPALKKNQTSNCAPNIKYIATPNDFLAVYSFAVIADNNYQYLLEKEVSYINESFPNTATRGIPRFYALFDDNTFIIGPTPSAGYDVELHYFYEPESIVTAGTSWLGDNTESVLFYGALVEAYTYMKGEQDLVALYTARYQDALSRLKNLGEGFDKRDSFRIDAPRMVPN